MENYLYRMKKYDHANSFIKTICNPRVTRCMIDAHMGKYDDGYGLISERGSWIPGGAFFDAGYEKICVIHYCTKSESEYRAKIERGWPDKEDDQEKLEAAKKERLCWLEDEETLLKLNEEYDPIMLKYAERLNK